MQRRAFLPALTALVAGLFVSRSKSPEPDPYQASMPELVPGKGRALMAESNFFWREEPMWAGGNLEMDSEPIHKILMPIRVKEYSG